MTLQELAAVKRWQVAHRRDHPVELHAWDLVLTTWLAGWVGLPTSWLLGHPWLMLLCTLGLLAPGLYVRARLRLHARRRLRCDWEYVIRAAHAMR